MLDRREQEIFEWFFSFIGYFNQFSFFTNKLWKNVKGFKNHNEADIKCLFMHYWTHHEFHIYSRPFGISWFSLVSEDSYNKYIQEYQPVIDAFEEWQMQQR